MKRVLCFIFGHRYGLVKEFTPYSRMVACKRCRNRWGMNDDARALVPWDSELEAYHISMGHFS